MPNPVPAPQPLQAEAGASEVQALEEVRSYEFRGAKKGESTAILPMGKRISTAPFIKARYNMKNAAAQLLGSADKIVKEAFRRDHRGYKYAWPVATASETQAYIRKGVYVKVPWESLNDDDTVAAVNRTPEGDIMWGQHLLVAIPPLWWDRLYLEPEAESIEKTAQNRAMVEAELNERFGAGGYAGEVEAFSDQRNEHVR
jgi:hypothetical protein